MYLSIGNDMAVRSSSIIGIFDLDNTTVSKRGREFLEKAEKDVLSKCFVLSSGDCLSNASKHSMNPYFKIEYRGENNE